VRWKREGSLVVLLLAEREVSEGGEGSGQVPFLLAEPPRSGVSFEEAQTVFLDDHAIRFFDPDHSSKEDRFIMLGMSFKPRVLVVCHCYKESDSVIRIISARKANRQESTHYRR
jgi:uncharacterized DUF497 family protein